MRVLFVEGYVARAKVLSEFLKVEGVVIECTHTGADALALLRHYAFDLVLLNLVLPDVDGTLLISRLRIAGHHLPVLALVGASSPGQRLAALSAGADDIVEHDTDRTEILARMRAIFRRSRGFSQPAIRCGEVTLHQERQDVTVDGENVHLTHKEFALLQLLMLRRNTVMTKEVILSGLYGGMDEPEVKIIDVYVCKIRSKLAKAGVSNLIETVRGRGYVVREIGRDTDTRSEPCIPAAGHRKPVCLEIA